MSSKAVYVNDLKKTGKATYKELTIRRKKLLISSPIKETSRLGRGIDIGRNHSLSRINRRCFYTGRKKGLIRYAKMTRMHFKKESSRGLVVGLRKSSW